MTGPAPSGGWRSDPYRRHELRYWDGLAWTPHVSDLGVPGHDPVFPVLDGDADTYLVPTADRRRRRRRLRGEHSAVWAIGGFVAVVCLAVASAAGTDSLTGTPRVQTVRSAADRPAATSSRTAAGLAPASRSTTAASAQPPAAQDGADGEPADGAPARALDVLGTLRVAALAATAHVDGTSTRWFDTDGNACDTRDDVLRRDLNTLVTKTGGCLVRSGTLHDPYTGRTVLYGGVLGALSLVQVDHVVELAAAWRTGAAQLPAVQQLALANDPLNLLAVSATAKARKGDADAAHWLPANADFRCAYVARQIAVKAAYRLWVTPQERYAMASVLATCPGEPLPSAVDVVPPAVPRPAAASSASSSTTTGTATHPIVRIFVSCAELNAVYPHGVGLPTAIDRTLGTPVTDFTPDVTVYTANLALDTDLDGVACEKR